MRYKILIDKLPESCFECPCFNGTVAFDCDCNLADENEDFYKDEFEENCPLELIDNKE